MTEKPKLILFGASHMVRLYKALDQKIKDKFDVQLFARSGATVYTVPKPDFIRYSSQDILWINILGNHVFRKEVNGVRNVFITQNPRIIHLRKPLLYSREENHKTFQVVWDSVKQFPGKIFMVSHIIRHYRCCPKHFSLRIQSSQNRFNNQAKEFFEKKLHFIDFRKLLPGNRNDKKKNGYLAGLQIDSVHFKREVYHEISKRMVAISGELFL